MFTVSELEIVLRYFEAKLAEADAAIAGLDPTWDGYAAHHDAFSARRTEIHDWLVDVRDELYWGRTWQEDAQARAAAPSGAEGVDADG